VDVRQHEAVRLEDAVLVRVALAHGDLLLDEGELRVGLAQRRLEARDLGLDGVGANAPLVNDDAAAQHVGHADGDAGAAPTPVRRSTPPSPITARCPRRSLFHERRERLDGLGRVLALADDRHRRAVRRHERQQAHDALAVGLGAVLDAP
jgi:hypothetical protein